MPQSYPPFLSLMECSNIIKFLHQEQAHWIEYSNALHALVEGRCPHPGVPPCGYGTYMRTNPSATNPSQYPRPPIVPAVNMTVEQTQSMADINMSAQGLKTILEAQVDRDHSVTGTKSQSFLNQAGNLQLTKLLGKSCYHPRKCTAKKPTREPPTIGTPTTNIDDTPVTGPSNIDNEDEVFGGWGEGEDSDNGF
ncbi:hypothetical protein BDQ17DRAFT_1323654 [Cyathus striatus]|nr:hypothetical protein BDQ17DRAFT_1323654 [Cyathus striatus]